MGRQTQADDATDEPTTDHPLLSNFDVDDHEQAHRDSVRECDGDGPLIELLTEAGDR